MKNKYLIDGIIYFADENLYFRKELMSLEFVSPKVGTIREISGEKFWIWKIGKRPIRNLFRVEIFWALDSGMRFLAYDRIVDEFFLRINKFII